MRHHWGSMDPRASPWLLRAGRPSAFAGTFAAAACVAVATLAVYPLAEIAPVVSLGVVYMPAVVVVAAYGGQWLGIGAAVASAVAFNFFHLPPVGQFGIADSRDWAALAAFTVVAIATGLIADLARARALEADQRRREADLAAELAQVLLGGPGMHEALALASQRLAVAIGVGAASLELQEATPGERQVAFALRQSDQRIGTLILPASLTPAERARVADRIVPPLESILAAALHRTQLQAEVVETAALRRSDEMKTAVLRSVSHDLRTPVTAILTAVSALDPQHPTPEDVREVREVVTYAGTRLARLIEKLLDLTTLQSGTLEPRREWYSIEEVLSEAMAGIDSARSVFQVSIDADIPLLQGDPGQLERAFGNLLENAARYSDGKPVSVRARAVGARVRVRIVDQGPGIRPHEQERIFMPFYRSPDAGSAHEGSGLGLAIAQGFITVGGGRVSVESLPGQGATFVVDLPVDPTGRPEAASDTAPPARPSGSPAVSIPERMPSGSS
jgi:two-component system sensor histidine kinase KdpD